ncbi:MAG: NAD(P)-binding domain-containing protein [Alphaproteobacteria bacterium]|jgi:3-hydroxyisobutyrate dehydrogenase-like beta-hydroxyacid dehydrogenase|nr:NAD(P)-binding domain-containing protein [Alphaproteobacteria bacterium]MDP6876650.1 NAD(P)-binding domain-containing protein [Alphaproteobacteria bacterium]
MSMASHESIGFVGLGGMGRGLVKNLLKHGRGVTVFDINDAALANAVAQGATAATDVASLAGQVDILAVCVTTAEVVQEMMLGDGGAQGALKRMRPGAVFLDHTTTSPAMWKS